MDREHLPAGSMVRQPSRPIFSYYGPSDPPWPRILVLGYEANHEFVVGDQLGEYDLSQSDVVFWTWSHAAVWRGAELTGDSGFRAESP